MTKEDRMLALVRSFPCLAFKLQDFDKWDATDFDQRMRACSSGERYAAQFVLAVWNPYAFAERRYVAGFTFDALKALGTWDASNRAAFLAWAAQPWWP